MKTIPDKAFFQRTKVTSVAADLLGKVLISDIGGHRTSGIIVETEAYSWKERGCHAFQNRMTTRNAPMFSEGGILYVYLCYGIHSLINIVTGKKGEAEAVLIRALEPVEGIEVMKKRMGIHIDKRITSGPGKLTKALGINLNHNQINILKKDSLIRIDDTGKVTIPEAEMAAVSRIGIQFAGDDAQLPWRFYIRNNPWVSVT